MLNKLKRKFITVNIVCVTVILTIVFGAVCFVTFRTERENVFRGLRVSADMIVFSENQEESASDTIFDINEPSFPTVTFFVDGSGNITETYAGKNETEASELLLEVAEDIIDNGKDEGILWEHSLIFVKGKIGSESFASIASLEVLTKNVRTVTRITGMSLFGCLVLFLILSYFLASVAIRPVKETWDGQKRFIEDASHDLKTPLTVILANTEIIKTRTKEDEETDKWLSSTKAEAERMRRLVDSMLELSSTEVSDDKIVLSDANLSEIAERTVLQMEPVAFEKNTIIKSTIAKNVNIKGNEDKLSRLLHILIDNGIKYSKPASSLFITLSRGKRYARLSVVNEGTYLNEEDIPHLFERFYRGDKARRGGGFGLGLSIAKNLATSMGGSIKAENKEGVGASFSVSFPLNEKLLPKFFYQHRSGKR